MAKLGFCLILIVMSVAFLSISYSEGRPLGTRAGSMENAAQHVMRARAWLSSSLTKEKPRRTSRLSPGGPDPKHH
ncbi:Clavata3/ESR [Sesbania bispinosa]|nr:Clavata3/ESR [Sesbania bispinosa]